VSSNLIERYDDNTYTDRQYADGIDEVVLLRSGDYYGQDIKAVVSDHLGKMGQFVCYWFDGCGAGG
jgi:hypothetical protein